MTEDITNEERAGYAAEALDRYGVAKEGRADYDPPEDMAADLMTDLLHLVAAHGTACPATILRRALLHFEAERLGGGTVDLVSTLTATARAHYAALAKTLADEDAGNDAVRDAAIDLCEVLAAFFSPD